MGVAFSTAGETETGIVSSSDWFYGVVEGGGAVALENEVDEIGLLPRGIENDENVEMTGDIPRREKPEEAPEAGKIGRRSILAEEWDAEVGRIDGRMAAGMNNEERLASEVVNEVVEGMCLLLQAAAAVAVSVWKR